jgi:DNA-binding LacI/PurR family transcriptional regulator
VTARPAGAQPAPRGRPVTIADVARHAGVSASTVSYVLSGKRAISAGTRARVLASVRALRFHPHAGARALAGNRANVIALALPLHQGMHLPVVMQFAAAVLTAARAHGQDVLLVTADEGAAGLRRIAGSAMVDGLILMDVETHDQRVPTLRELDRPSVLIGLPAELSAPPEGPDAGNQRNPRAGFSAPSEGPGAGSLPCVDLDFERAGALCVEHLAGLGHRRIVLLGAPQVVYDRDTGFARRTREGVRVAAERHGLSASARAVEPVYPAALAAVEGCAEATGLIVHNEGVVDHVLTALRALGRRVPQDISVLAICPDDVALAATPHLTNVNIPASQVGRLAVELLMARLDGAEVAGTTLLSPVITDRASTAVPVISTSIV